MIDARQRRERIGDIYDNYTVQCGHKAVKELGRKLEQQDRLIRIKQARAYGRRNQVLEMTEREAAFLDTQGSEYLSDWSESERERFKQQQSSMWSLIPERHRGQAERYAAGQ